MRKKGCTLLFTHHGLMPSPSPGSDQWLPANSPHFIYWEWHSLLQNIPLASLGQLSWLCPTLFYWCWGDVGETAWMLCGISAQQQTKQSCVNSFLARHAKITTMRTAMGETSNTQYIHHAPFMLICGWIPYTSDDSMFLSRNAVKQSWVYYPEEPIWIGSQLALE